MGFKFEVGQIVEVQNHDHYNGECGPVTMRWRRPDGVNIYYVELSFSELGMGEYYLRRYVEPVPPVEDWLK